MAITHSQRAPQVQELFSNGYHDATRSYELGDPSLHMETSYNLDLGYKFKTHGVKGELDLFNNWANDYIYQQRTGNFVTPNFEATVNSQTLSSEQCQAVSPTAPCTAVTGSMQADAIFRGYESKLIFPIMENRHGMVDLTLFSDYTRGQFVNGGNVPRLPPLRFGFQWDYSQEQWSTNLRFTRAQAQNDVGTNDTPTSGYYLLTMGGEYQIKRYHDTNIMIYLKSKSDHRLKSVTLLAAQVDFKLAGELLVFIDENQLSSLKANMDKTGYLDGNQMGSAFNLLHSQDLIWGKIVQDYLIGERKPLFDIMAWNADVTRLPAKMHSEYLEKLFLKNAFTEGEFSVNNQVVSLIDINIPIFAVGTVADHVAPWKSVYKINLLTKTEVTFVLTTGGHNVGIVSEPGHPGRSYQVMVKKSQDNFMHHDLWKKNAPFKEGSWWIEWQSWLAINSTDKVQPPNIVDPNKGYVILGDAPGTYVLKK